MCDKLHLVHTFSHCNSNSTTTVLIFNNMLKLCNKTLKTLNVEEIPLLH